MLAYGSHTLICGDAVMPLRLAIRTAVLVLIAVELLFEQVEHH